MTNPYRRPTAWTNGATVVDLAAYLGVTPARVRQIVRAHGIDAVGTQWKAKLYPALDVLNHANRRCNCTQTRDIGYSH